jgi:hypothetical protein
MNSPRGYRWPRYWALDLIDEGLVELARAAARRAQKRKTSGRRICRWQCLRPGADTPLWNALAGAVEAHLRKRGAKSRLARLLGVSRQRLHLLIVAKTAYPDAERALLLQLWLQARMLHQNVGIPTAAEPISPLSSVK